ncbi:hypothetical protein QZH41_009080, partial [Actinostola sp. cb2023]
MKASSNDYEFNGEQKKNATVFDDKLPSSYNPRGFSNKDPRKTSSNDYKYDREQNRNATIDEERPSYYNRGFSATKDTPKASSNDFEFNGDQKSNAMFDYKLPPSNNRGFSRKASPNDQKKNATSDDNLPSSNNLRGFSNKNPRKTSPNDYKYDREQNRNATIDDKRPSSYNRGFSRKDTPKASSNDFEFNGDQKRNAMFDYKLPPSNNRGFSRKASPNDQKKNATSDDNLPSSNNPRGFSNKNPRKTSPNDYKYNREQNRNAAIDYKVPSSYKHSSKYARKASPNENYEDYGYEKKTEFNVTLPSTENSEMKNIKTERLSSNENMIEKGLSKKPSKVSTRNHRLPLATSNNYNSRAGKTSHGRLLSRTKVEPKNAARQIVDDNGVFQNTQKRILKWMSYNYGRLIDVFKRCDVDNSGSLSLEEFYQGMKSLGAPGTQTELYMMAKALDFDDDETIEYHEFRKIKNSYKKSATKRRQGDQITDDISPPSSRLQPCKKCYIGISEPLVANTIYKDR